MASIKKRKNSYLITVSISVNGKSERRYLTWRIPPGTSNTKAEKEAYRLADEFERKLRFGYFIDPNITFSEFADQWQKEYANKQHRKTTITREIGLLGRIMGSMGNVRLSKIQPQHIRDFMSKISADGMRQDRKYICKIDIHKILKNKKMKKKDFVDNAQIAYSTFLKVVNGEPVSYLTVSKIAELLDLNESSDFELISGGGEYSGKTLMHYYRLISKILSDAVRWGYIIENPCLRVEPPKLRKKRVVYLDDKQIQEFISALSEAEEPFRTAILLLLYLGCRRGELLGLHWDDIDLVNSTVDINKSLLYTPGHGVFIDDTKTEESVRTISIPESMSAMLGEYRSWQDQKQIEAGDQWKETDFVFTNWRGEAIRPDRLTCWMRDFTKRYNLPKITLKGLRHTAATLLIMNGLNIRSVANRLGHAKTSTTTDIYSHAIKSMDEVAGEMIDRIINGSQT